MADRTVIIVVRNKQTTGGSLPPSAKFGEPFVNLYDGVLRFSGITGGSFESSSESGVFEVGSKLYNSNITNRLSINNNFIISGDTGIISTYNGNSSLSGKFLSGSSTGFVLANISEIEGTAAGSSGDIQFNDGSSSFTSDSSFNYDVNQTILRIANLSGGTITGSTFYSGTTNLYDIFTTGPHTQIQPGSNISTGGTVALPIINIVASPSFNNLTLSGTGTAISFSGSSLSGETIYSGSTNLENIIRDLSGESTKVQPGYNIITGGTSAEPIISVNGNPSFSGHVTSTGLTVSNLTSGRIPFISTGGLLSDESGFEYNSGTNILTVENIETAAAGSIVVGTGGIIVGAAGVGDVTIHGNLLVLGDTISGFTSELYIEDNRVELNFNPTATTISTSLGSGLVIQDGSGVDGTDVYFDIRGASTGVSNRSWATNLEDIRIRESGTFSSPNGVRLLAESDTLDGGSY